jgi:hypothetical protein
MSAVSFRILVCMAGKGQRFRSAGYEAPKFALLAGGRTLLNWSLSGLSELFNRGRFLFAFCDADNRGGYVARLISAECSSLGIRDFETIALRDRTKGQAETALLALAGEPSEAPLLIWNIDTYVEPRALTGIGRVPRNAIYCFEVLDEHPYSWVRKDPVQGYGLEVREKQKISNCASIGLYEFSTAECFQEAYVNTYAKQDVQLQGELFVAPLFNALIRKGIVVDVPILDASAVHILGTPSQYDDWRTRVDVNRLHPHGRS